MTSTVNGETLNVETDSALAARLAVQAGHLLVRIRDELTRAGAPAWHVMDAGDLASHRFIAQELAAVRPDDAVLSEEGLEDARRFNADRVWIVDPLDGTSEFGEPGRADWAVHIALWDADHLAAGAVSIPALDLIFCTDPAPVLPQPQRARPILVTSRTRNPYVAVVVANALDAEPVRLGSAGAKAMAVVAGDADIYVHDGGMYSGTLRHLQQSRSPPACMSAESMAHPWCSTIAIRGCPTC